MKRRARLVLLGFVCGLVCLGGCNAVAWKRGRHESTFRDAGLKPSQVTLGDATVRYWSGGADGPPVLLLHGFGASAIWQWFGQVEALAKHHRVIAPDLLWFGGSSSTRRDFSVDYQMATLVALLDHLKTGSVRVAGISYGGFVAYELAAEHPARVERLVIIDSPARTYTKADYAGLCKRYSVAHIGTVLVPTDTEGVQTLLEIAKYDPDWAPGWAKQQVLDQLYSARRKEQVALLDSLIAAADDLAGRTSRPAAPALLIWGSDDPVFPVALGRRLEKHLGPQTRLEIIGEARHAPNLEHPERVSELLLGFFGE